MVLVIIKYKKQQKTTNCNIWIYLANVYSKSFGVCVSMSNHGGQFLLHARSFFHFFFYIDHLIVPVSDTGHNSVYFSKAGSFGGVCLSNCIPYGRLPFFELYINTFILGWTNVN